MDPVFTFIGAGKMASAIACGLRNTGIEAALIQAYDISSAAGEAFKYQTNGVLHDSMKDALAPADIVILAVKPQYAAEALAEAKEYLQGKMLLSIAAGLTLEWLKEHSGLDRIIRVMPNTPALAGAGMSCFAAAEECTEDDIRNTEIILGAIGKCRQVPENLLDAVTGLSGSGPAFVMEFIMGLADGGTYAGLPHDMALELALQTVLGTAKMCQESALSVGELRDSVISAGGTTSRGILELQKNGFKGVTASAVIKAAERSAELGGKK